MANPLKNEQLREFIKKYPNYPNLKLARMFHAETQGEVAAISRRRANLVKAASNP